MTETSRALDLLTDLIGRARRAGADAADAVLVEGVSVSHAQRLGEIEKLERSEGQGLGLRVLLGRRQAIVSSDDKSGAALDALVARAVAMARVVPEDEFCGIADPDQITRDFPDLDLNDPVEPSAEALIERARAAEDAARSVAGVTNSEGAEAGWGHHFVALAASNGFAGAYEGSSHSVSVSVVAQAGDAMERDYDWSSAAWGADLEDAAVVGARAGARAVKRLGARKVPTCRVPILFDPRCSASFIGHLIGAISGGSITRGTSFLKDRLGEAVMAPGITIIDDPHRLRGPRSKPFDAEGLATRRRALIDQGVLTTWLLDLRSARQLKLAPTGHAARGTSGPPGPSPTNLHIVPGTQTRAAMLGEIEQGLYVTEFMGSSVSIVTGDYSRGAAGFWIENGELTHPVSEITVAGNLREMFMAMAAADDLEFRSSSNAPTLRIDGMVVAGS